jgi:hypothetical protein
VKCRYEKYVVKEDQPDGAREKGPDPFMDEYAFILQQADDLTLVTTLVLAQQ